MTILVPIILKERTKLKKLLIKYSSKLARAKWEEDYEGWENKLKNCKRKLKELQPYIELAEKELECI